MPEHFKIKLFFFGKSSIGILPVSLRSTPLNSEAFRVHSSVWNERTAGVGMMLGRFLAHEKPAGQLARLNESNLNVRSEEASADITAGGGGRFTCRHLTWHFLFSEVYVLQVTNEANAAAAAAACSPRFFILHLLANPASTLFQTR